MTLRRKERQLIGGAVAVLALVLLAVLLLGLLLGPERFAPRSGAAAASDGLTVQGIQDGSSDPELVLGAPLLVGGVEPVSPRRSSPRAPGAKGTLEVKSPEGRIAIHVHLTDSNGEPAAGVGTHLYAYPEPATKAARQEFLQRWTLESTSFNGETSADGAVHFDGLPPCSYSLWVEEPVEEELPSAVLVDQDARWDLTLLPRIRLSGQVYASCGSSVEVHAYEVDGLLESVRSLVPEGQATADASGHYEIKGLQPGRYEVLFFSEGCATTRRELRLLSSLEDYDVSLSPGLEFSGRITCSVPAGVERISVSLSPDPLAQDLFGSASSDDGRFRFRGLAPGTYELAVWVTPKDREAETIKRRLLVELTQDVRDYAYVLSTATARVRIRTDVPPVKGAVDGRLQATGPHGNLHEAVRLFSGAATGSHQVWEVVPNGMGARGRFRRADAFELDLPLGAWDLRLELAGYRPWSARVAVTGDTEVVAALGLRDGRAVDIKLASNHYLVESRRTGDGPWAPLSSRRDLVSPNLTFTPESGWLPAGLHDLRVSTSEHKELIIRELRVTAGHGALQLAPALEEGLNIAGRLYVNARPSTNVALYLSLWEEGRWRPLPTKTCWAFSRYKQPGKHFYFQGLHPGRYRVALDEGGRQSLDEWTLSTSDLAGLVLTHEFR